ncbi:MAG: AMP-dependent synthetase [Gammaproteobacteria bacterium]|nr:AMP-dependent synthetase [Gammaproteobacteria bacterium]
MSDLVITPAEAQTLPGLFRLRVQRTPEACAYRFFDALNGAWTDLTWRDMAREVARWQAALAREKMQPGDRVAIMARNSRFWVIFDQAALALGLVLVPLYTEDRVDNVSYVLRDSGARLLVIGGPGQWDRLQRKLQDLSGVKRIISIAEIPQPQDKRLVVLDEWLDRDYTAPPLPELKAEALATIVYTSGTTGAPKGVMLSHWNILSNAYSGSQTVPITAGNVFLSFLPLSHTLERTVGYYLPMMAGATVAHSRGISELSRDLHIIKPSALISVPRIFERVYARLREQLDHGPRLARLLFQITVDTGWRRFQYMQGRSGWHPALLLWPLLKRVVADKVTERLGGRLRVAISGGAALAPEISRVLVALGVPILQGYGLTEASPVVSVNRLDDNIPESIGPALPGVAVNLGEHSELLVRGDSVMLGYWNNEPATAAVLDAGGWLHTGDKARIEGKHIFITGRLKDIIVLANGEKVSPTDMELAITTDPLFEQVVILGEARPFLSALAVLNRTHWRQLMQINGLADAAVNEKNTEKILLDRIAGLLHEFPGHAQIHRLHCVTESWTIENDLLTATLKVKRKQILEKYAAEIVAMYAGHTI